MKITDVIRPECVKVPLAATDKLGAIRELVEVLGQAALVNDTEAVFHSILEREQTRSTGIGKGLAVPHGKCPACKQLVMALGKPTTPIDFGSRDERPVDVIVLLASPLDQTGPHIQALARVSRLMLNEAFRRDLASAKDGREAYEAIRRHEGNLT